MIGQANSFIMLSAIINTGVISDKNSEEGTFNASEDRNEAGSGAETVVLE